MKNKRLNKPSVVSAKIPAARKKDIFDKLWSWLSSCNYKYAFYISVLIVAMLTFYMSSKTELNCDAPMDYENGKQCLDFYLSAGKDTSCLYIKTENFNLPYIKYYGVGFESSFVALQKIIKPNDFFQLRMYYLALWGIVLLVFMGLMAKELCGWQGAVLAIWLAFLTPFLLGQFFWDTKDIPHTLGYAIALFFMLRFFKQLPKITIGNALGVALGIAVGLSIRIGGVLIVCYWGLFMLLSCFLQLEIRRLFVEKKWQCILAIALVAIVVSVGGILLGLLFYPNFWVHGLSHIVDAMRVLTQFPLNTPFLFEGERVLSTNLPWYYLPKSVGITLPILVLILLFIALPTLFIKRKKIGSLNVFILFFTVIFPFAYIMYTHATLYNSWRHVLFAYVAVPAILAVTVVNALNAVKKIPVKILLLCSLLVSMFYLLVWNVKYAPYQLAYYNQFVGGTKGAFKKYDFDMVHFAAPAAARKLLKTLSSQDYSEENPLIIAVTNEMVSKYFYIPEEWKGKLKVKEIAYRNYATVECDYAIMALQFSIPQVLSFFYPPKGTISKEMVDGVPIACVVDRRNDTDYKGIKLIQENKSREGMELLEQAYAYNPNNFSMYFWMGYGYYQTGNYTKSIDALNAYKRFYTNDKDTHRLLGYSFYADKQYDKALDAFNVYFAQDQSDLSVAYVMGLCLYEKKDYIAAKIFLEPLVNENPSFVDGHNLLRHIQTVSKK